MAKKNEDKLPAWDLGDLYRGVDDPRIDRDLQKARRAADGFVKRYRGKLARHAGSPERLRRVIAEYEDVMVQGALPGTYAALLFADSSSDERRGGLLQRVDAASTDISNRLVFFDLELLSLDAGKLRRLANAKGIRPYGNYLQRLLASKPHRLSEREERLLNEKELTSSAAFSRLFTEEFAAKRFSIAKGKRREELNEHEVLALLYDPDRSRRKAAAEALSAGLQADSRRLAFIYGAIVQDWDIDDRLRSFAAPEAARHLSNQIDASAVDTMTKAVTRRYDIVRKFYRFKRKLLGYPTLYDYDRYAPVLKKEKKYPFAWAKQQVLAAFERFSPRYAELADDFFKKRWIDAAARPGKRSGAFCMYVTPNRHPYVFLNYNGSLRDVFTLAHELGHAVHARLMQPQGYLAFRVPLTVAETASVFSEMLLFDHLRETLDDAGELFAMYASTIEGIFATVFRQISMYRFEQDAHRVRARAGHITTKQLNAIWRKRSEEMFGDSIELTEGYDCWWSYIPHFVHSPFYVYAYAFGELLTLALYARYRKTGADFVDEYIALLAAGATLSPDELVAPLGIDLHSRSFWNGGLSIIDEMVEELQTIGGHRRHA